MINENFFNFDIIADIHGEYQLLVLLLIKLGYIKRNHDKDDYYHPNGRKVLFLGDYIDRGNEQKKTVNLVKLMVENNDALALMGNHEFNAIMFAKKFREHSEKNIRQHSVFLKEFPFNSDEYHEIIEFFKTLPFCFENKHINAIHACWHNEAIEYFKNKNKSYLFTENDYENISNKTSKEYILSEIMLKGYEIETDFYWTDNDGNSRNTHRIKWFQSKDTQKTFKNFIMDSKNVEHVNDFDIDVEFYEEDKPVFFGHYWFKGLPSIISEKIACLDFSAVRNGYLVAYRYDEKNTLSNNNLVYVSKQDIKKN